MKRVIAAAVAAAFSLGLATTAMAAPVQINQTHSQAEEAQATPGKPAQKKKAAKKKAPKKQAAKKAAAKKKPASA